MGWKVRRKYCWNYIDISVRNKVPMVQFYSTGQGLHSIMFDSVDRKIIRCLLRKPRTTLRDIAKSVGVTRTTVRNRLKKLFDNNYITIRILFNMGQCNFKFALLGLTFSEFKEFNKCLQIAMYCPRVAILVKNISKYHIFMVLMAENDDELHHVIDEFQFISGVKDSHVEYFTSVNLLKPVFIDFAPFSLLDPDKIRDICDNCPMNLFIEGGKR